MYPWSSGAMPGGNVSWVVAQRIIGNNSACARAFSTRWALKLNSRGHPAGRDRGSLVSEPDADAPGR